MTAAVFTAHLHVSLEGVIAVEIEQLTSNDTPVHEMFSSALFLSVLVHGFFFVTFLFFYKRIERFQCRYVKNPFLT